MRLDHVSYAVSAASFAPTLQRLGAQLGASFADGGVHPRFGTRNVVLPCADGTYVEIVSPLDHPAAERMPFGQAVRSRADDGGGWMGWVVAVDDLAPIEQRLGRSAADGHRVLPSGDELQWKQIGVLDLMRDPQLPFFVHWSTGSKHPSLDASGRIRIRGLEIAGDESAVQDWLGGPVADVLGNVAISWAPADEPGLVAVEFDTPSGPIRID